MCQEHNGYKNYPTFLVGLWVDNNAIPYQHVMNTACEFVTEADPHGFTEWLKEDITNLMLANTTSAPGLLRNDLLNAALELVDWQELADQWYGLAAERITEVGN